MKLKYAILWIDNELQSYIDNGDVDSIKKFLIDYGFEPVIETVFDEAKLDEYIFLHEYDLIISDYKLEETTGDEVIKKIRDKGLDTEIIFYTSQDSYMKNDAVKKRLAFVERLFFQVGRDGLMNKIEKVINLTLKKLLEINATRGLIVSETSDLDVEIEEIYYMIINMIEKNISNNQEVAKLKEAIHKILASDANQVGEDLKKNIASQEKYICEADYKTYFDKRDSYRKWKILQKIIALDMGNILQNFDINLFKKYQKDVIEVRNKFAHAKLIELDGKTFLKGRSEGQDFEFNYDSCIRIRQNLILHKTNIQNLKRSILNYET
jgi:CheY-like chemotaxis protein